MLASSHVTKCTYMYMYCAVWAFCSLRTTEPKADLQIQKCLIKREHPITSNIPASPIVLMYMYASTGLSHGNDDVFFCCSLIFLSTYTCISQVVCAGNLVFTQICHTGLSACKEWCALCMCCLLCLMYVYQHRYVLWVL